MIWAKQIPHVLHPVPFHSPKTIVCCDTTANFITGLFFFEWIISSVNNWAGHVTCTVTAARLLSVLRYFAIPEQQKHGILDSMIFMQDGAPLYIDTCVTQLLTQHFPIEWLYDKTAPLHDHSGHQISTPVAFVDGVISKALFMVII